MIYYTPGRMTWRNQYNPLRALTLAKVVSALESAERGLHSEIQWIYRFIEKRDATLRAVVRRRISAIQRLDWTIKARSDQDDSPEVQRQTESLRTRLEAISNLNEAVAWLATSEFRGFAHLEKHYGDGDVIRLEPVPQWHWAQRFPSRAWLYNEKADYTDFGVPTDRQNFIVRETPDPINEVAVIAFLRKNMSQKDWDGFIETYGLPPAFLSLPETAKNSEVEGYQQIAEDLIADGRGVLPHGASIIHPPASSRARDPFSEHIKYQDEQIVMAGTSGKLTMLNDPTGLGSGQSEVHADTFASLAEAEAQQISEIINRELCAEFLAVDHPGEEQLVYFALEAQQREDKKAIVADAVALKSAGWEMDAAELAERTGYTLSKAVPTERPGVTPGLPAMRFRRSTITNDLRSEAAKALANDLSESRKRLEAALAIEDDTDREAALRKLAGEMPELLKRANENPELAKPLEAGLTEAILQGMKEALAAVPNRKAKRRVKSKPAEIS